MTEVTGRAVGFVAACPELLVLELAPLAPEIHAHVDLCESCQLVLELLAFGDDGAAVEACARFEPLIAARADGELGASARHLLARHLESCGECRSLGATLAPRDPADPLDSLPEVSPEHYELGSEVARGGMGRIFAARDVRVGRKVAVKELRQRSQQLAARFAREARITARLQHPGIVPIYEIGRWPDGTPFYSMRMVDGRTLHRAIAAAPTLAERLVLLPAVIATTEAVAFAHAQRIIHRDLTPSNVLVGAYGETVVIDWGLAKQLGEPDEPIATELAGPAELTVAGAVVGTAAYMPPEQARAEAVDERSDVYALGAILYHLLAGAAPYRGDEAIEQVKAGPPPAIEDAAPAAPRDLLSIVDKAMAREPQDRYASAAVLADELKRFQAGRLVQAHEYTAGERVRRFIARNRAPLVVTAIAAGMLLGLGSLAVRRIVRARSAAEHEVLALLEEEGRSELLDGETQRAFAYFEAATPGGVVPPRALAFMRAAALRELTTVVDDLDCGGTVNDLSFDPTHTLLVASCHDRTRAWRIADRSMQLSLEACNGGCDHLEYDHGGTRLATYGEDGVVRLWDARTGAKLRELRHGTSSITFATFTPDDKLLLTTGYDGFARVWDVATGTQLRQIRGSDALFLKHLYGVLSKDGARILTFTIEGEGAGFDLATGAKIGEVHHGAWAIGGALSPTGELAATCGTNKLVKLWSTSKPELVETLAGATDAVLACKFSDDGTRVIGTSQDGRAYVWDVATGSMVSQADHGTRVWSGHFSHDGSRFVTIGVGDTAKVWDSETGGLLATHELRGGHEAIFSPDGRYLIAARGDGRIRIWRDPAGPLQATYEPRDRAILVAYSEDGRYAIEGEGQRLRIVDVATHGSRELKGYSEPVAIANGVIAATTTEGVAIIDAATGIERSPATESFFRGHPHRVELSADGAFLFVEAADEVVRVDAKLGTGMFLRGPRHHVADATGEHWAAWSDDGRLTLVDHMRVLETIHVDGTPIAITSDGTVLIEDREHRISRVAHDHSLKLVAEDVISATLDPTARFLTTIDSKRLVKTRDLIGGGETSFVSSEPLQTAQANPTGELVAGVDRRGTMVMVFGSGRMLARWQIAHPALSLLQDTLIDPYATARWSLDGNTIVSKSRQLARWNATSVDDSWIQRLLAPSRTKVAWRFDGSQLVRTRAALHAMIERSGAPLANQPVSLVFRKPSDLVGGATSWSSAGFKILPHALVTDGHGAITLEDLEPGTYELHYLDQHHLLDVEVDDVERTITF
jgi:WD40 repeat protein